mmetsp:Transcript_3520/g.4698  ORF Transcript_3520/g.4698 Transcript_3520/m.4698 type:complete len:316 (+) Transcript_3520:34-981(+)
MFPRYALAAQRAFSVGAGKNVGFIGLGCMGLPMSTNLKQAGFTVKGYDLSPQAREAAQEAGITAVDSIAEASTDVDYVVTALPETRHIEETLKMDGGVFASARQGTLICDVSTIHPDGARRFHADAKKVGLTYLDTPMSGGITGARNGTLTFMIGGSAEEFEASKGVLQGMGANFFHCGEPGTGEIAKLTNNLILGISMVAASEGMAIGEKLGIDPAILQKILAVSTARNWCIDTYNPRPGLLENVPAANNYEGGFAVGLIKKDMVLALEAAHNVKAQTDMLEKSLQYYLDLEKAGLGKKDFGYVFQYIMKNKHI